MAGLTYDLAAVAAAVAFAVAATLGHRSAGEVPDAQGLGPRQMVGFIRASLAHPYWLGGIAVGAVGLGLQAVALYGGALAVVQPLLVLGVLVALPLQRRLRHERIHRSELGWALALVTGLAGFLLVATVGVPATHATADRGPAIAAGLLALGAATGCVVLARARPGTTAAAALGTATGIAFAGIAALIKSCTILLSHGLLALVSGWQLYALLGAGVVGLLLNQLSFQAGPLSASLPAITVIDPLVAVVIGVVVYDENLRHTPWAIPTETAAMLLFTAAAFVLTRHHTATTAPTH
ncbi:MAG: hypothetical protein DLM62_07890 [Pseudonocardiales bacterium]|nr:MAG: hypothetical protein DLM62_07890 [Pseudonocardiales bacterium]